ncbi:MAG: T9SS type A sorting domain-containing protein [bacterium]
MSQKLTTSLLLILMMFSFSLSYSRDNRGKEVKATTLDGSEIGTPNNNAITTNSKTTFDNQPLTTTAYPVAYHPFGLSSFYDLQSNGSTDEIWQNPLAPDNVHAAVMVLPVFGGTRFVNYLLSADRGTTWSLLGNVAESQSGFPSINGFPDVGKAIVTMHTTAGGAAAARSQVFVDQGAGFGVFDRLDPGMNALNSDIWGRIITTGLSTNPVKFVLTASVNGAAIASTNTGSSLTPPGTFSGWVDYNANTAEQYCLGLGQDGRIGNAYVVADAVDQGSVAFRESVDNGLTWSAPTTVFNASIDADSLGAFRGISMIYLGNTPCVTYELDMITAAGFFPTLPSKIMFWSPAINAGAPKEVAGPNNVTFYPNNGPNAGVYTPLCRPVIGKTNTGSQNLFLAFNGTTNQNAADSNTYYATYFLTSYNGGNTWTNSTGTSVPERITPTTPLTDFRYVSMSHTSSPKSTLPGSPWLVQMTVQTHGYAGAFAPSMPPGPSDFVGMTVEVPFGSSVNEISGIVPDSYSLKQNFPNPFNPSTSIRFDIQRSANVTLKVYNSNGQEVETLINNELVTPGTKEVVFNANSLSSGIYFYTLSAGDFKETKKMMLIK